MADLLAKEQLDRFKDLKGKRSSIWDPSWQDITDYTLPQMSNVNTQKTEGTTGWTDRIYDTTAILAAQTCRAGQLNWLTPASEPWAAFEAPEFLNVAGQEEAKDEAAQWLSMATDVTMRELARSNFYAMVSLDYLQVCTAGTGMLFADTGKKTALNFRQFTPWSLTIEEDDEGIVDTVRREFKLTARQAVQWFGKDNCGERVMKAYNGGKHSQQFDFVHAVFPREESKRIKGRMDGPMKPVASVYINVAEMICVEVSGYDEMPYLCSRFDKWGTDAPWGYSPAFLILPEARQINYVSQYRDALAELKAYPRFLYPDSLEGDVDLRAGGITTVNADDMVRGAMPKEWMTVGDDKAAEDNMARKADAINKAYYVNMFTMLEQLADKKMTAYEIAQRLGEKLEQFTPVFYRRVGEFLNPLLRRVFGILYRQGKFGQAPQSLMVKNLGDKVPSLAMPEIAITSRISLALKALQNQGIVNTLQILEPMAQLKPEIMDNFNLDALVRELARNYGTPPDILRTFKEIKGIRDQRQKMMMAQQAIEMAQGAAKAGASLGKAPQAMQDEAMQAA